LTRTAFTPAPSTDHWHAPIGPGTVIVTQLLGPLHISFDDFGGTGGNFPVALAVLPIGCFLMAVFMRTTTAWSGGGTTTAQLAVDLAPTADLTNGDDYVTGLDLQNQQSDSNGHVLINEVSDSAEIGLVTGDTTLIAYIQSLNGTPTAGKAEIYAIIATPAS